MKSSLNVIERNVQRARLGDYICCSTANNRNLEYGAEFIEGVTSEGIFSSPKGESIDVDLKPYKIVNTGAFVYNPSRLNLGSIAYRTGRLCIVSHLYVVFYLNEKGLKKINPEYLYIYFRRNEFYREVTFRNFGSQRPEFNFNDLSEIIIPIPEITIQQKYVDIYKAMVANQQSYERGLEDLKLTFETCMHNLICRSGVKSIENYVELVENTNDNLNYDVDNVRGISIEKKLIKTKANMSGVNLRPYYIVSPNDFAYAPVTSRNGGKISIALNDTLETYICSSSYIVFRSKNPEKLLPLYLMLYFSRSEFDRYARFNSWGSARETFDWNEMCNLQIPIPDIELQKAVAEIYAVYIERKQINEQLKQQIKDISPVLVKGSLEEGVV